MTIKDGDWETTLTDEATVLWDNTEGSFTVYPEADQEVLRAGRRGEQHRDFQEIVDEYLEAGWKKDSDTPLFHFTLHTRYDEPIGHQLLAIIYEDEHPDRVTCMNDQGEFLVVEDARTLHGVA